MSVRGGENYRTRLACSLSTLHPPFWFLVCGWAPCLDGKLQAAFAMSEADSELSYSCSLKLWQYRIRVKWIQDFHLSGGTWYFFAITRWNKSPVWTAVSQLYQLALSEPHLSLKCVRFQGKRRRQNLKKRQKYFQFIFFVINSHKKVLFTYSHAHEVGSLSKNRIDKFLKGR